MTIRTGHLTLHELVLPASAEWLPDFSGWLFARITQGIGYALRNGSATELAEGQVVVACLSQPLIFRASQLGTMTVHCFRLCPEMLTGFFTLHEEHYLQTAAPQRKLDLHLFPPASPVAMLFADLSPHTATASSLTGRGSMLAIAVAALKGDLAEYQFKPQPRCDAGERFKQLIASMPAAEIQNGTVPELARQCGCSERHFSRLFRSHFGFSVSAKQTEMRLRRAQQLLRESDAKIIYVAMESGFRHLGLFNAMFKKRFGMTPSEWRQQNTKKKTHRRIIRLSIWAGLIGAMLWQAVPAMAQATNAPPQPATAASQTNAPSFAVRAYDIQGNTVLPREVIDKIVADYTGSNVTFEKIRSALAELQLAYRGRGYVSVGVSLPQQQLTNGVVRVLVVEGKLSEIRVVDNHYFSSNNVMRSLPYARTNIILNSQRFQLDLDAANSNPDRTIYPVIAPGPEPGTTALTLKIKDRLPLHAHADVNNQSTPGTPDLRMNFAAQYNNLWQLEHQIGIQYLFSPEAMKTGDKLPWHFFDQPAIASYSAFYRLPISFREAGPGRTEVATPDFGFNEVTRRFQPPPPTGKTELIVYASRSTSDSGSNLIDDTLTPAQIPPKGGLQVSSSVYNQTLSQTANLGIRLMTALPPAHGFRSSISGGLDFKSYHTESLQTRLSRASLFIPPQGASEGPPFIIEPAPETPPSSRTLRNTVEYLPLTLSWDISRPDSRGFTALSINQSFNISGLIDDANAFRALAQSTNASGTFYVLNAGITREQRLFEEWSLLFRANGQWATEPLISNEQVGLGGLTGVRGYRDGQEYGDAGWRMLLDLRTPTVDIGMVDGTMPMIVRASVFSDYGERYLFESGASREPRVQMWGAGFGFTATIGQTWDFRFACAWPLLEAPGVSIGRERFYFSAGAQF